MKVFISADMEGVAGVHHNFQIDEVSPAYQMARKWMTAEVNAAIRGALSAGATEVVVADSHGRMNNLLLDELEEKTQIIQGTPRGLCQMEGIDSTFSAAFLIGYHAKAGTVRGILAHTYVGGLISEIRLNGIPVGEAELNAAIAGYYGVPVVLVSGDNTLADATKISLPWAEQVITKWALSPLAARSITPKLSQKLIFEASEKALTVLSKTKPFVIESPISMEIDFLKTPPAFLASDIPGVTLQNGRSVVFTAENILEAFKYFRIMVNMAFGDYWL